MPVLLNANSKTKNAVKSAYDVKYFHSDFTGTGKAIGLINRSIYPAALLPHLPEIVDKPLSKIATHCSGNVKEVTFPIDPLANHSRLNMKVKQTKRNSCELAECGTLKLYVEFTPVALMIRTVKRPNEPLDKFLITTYRIDFIEESQTANGTDYTIVESCFSMNPQVLLNNLTINNSITLSNKQTYSLSAAHRANYDIYLNGYDLYNELCEVSKIWQTTITDSIVEAYDADPSGFKMRHACKYISNYRLSMKQYQLFYQELKKRFTADEIKEFTKANTYILLQDTLENLQQIQFAPLPTPSQIPNYQSPDFSWCSREQLTSIKSNAPLNLVQAGAGTGKSTTIKARIEYLMSLGVNPEDILVLSFTNAAADNMKAKAPNIQSMTIAKMIDTIYTLNHPTHKLSTAATRHGEGSTFTNTLSQHVDTNPFAEKLIEASIAAENKNDYATLLTLIENEYDDIIDLLDTVEQTTFQIQIILTYLEHAKLNIPFNIKHLIIDEVQDCAVFEFIFLLNLTCKLNCHVYLVGDCSQTLYEFRASDPKALSTIENSPVFQTYPLNVNYRSNQAILSFANSLLTDIEANRSANIKLQSFKLSQFTQADFTQAVTVDYTRLARLKELPEFLEKRIATHLGPWIQERLDKQEQICVLTYTRRESLLLQGLIARAFPSAEILNITSAKNIAFAYFSNYVTNCDKQIQNLPTTSAFHLCTQIHNGIIDNLPGCNIHQSSAQYPKIEAKVKDLIKSWTDENTQVLSDKLIELQNGKITRGDVIKTVCESLIDFEIRENGIKQTITSQRNASRKSNTKNADIIFSTIHGAKGLEFDHTIVLYRNDNNMPEDDKRMYYVALTRAKKSEYVLGYGTHVNAVLVTRHDSVKDKLPIQLTMNAQGQVSSIVNSDGSVINYDGTGTDTRGNALNADGSITFNNGQTITPDSDGKIDLTSQPA